MHDFDRRVFRGEPDALRKLVILILLGFIAGGLLTLAGCGGGGSYSGGGQVKWSPNLSQAHANVMARDPRWLAGLASIIQVDKAPPAGVNAAVVKCRDRAAVLFDTTFDMPVKTLEGLIVHEALESRTGCDDHDKRSGEFVQCYHEGGTVDQCTARVFPWLSDPGER